MDDLNLNLDDLLSVPLEFTEIENLLKGLQGSFEACKRGRGTPSEIVAGFKKEVLVKLQEANTVVSDGMVFSPAWSNRPPVVEPVVTWLGVSVLEDGNISLVTSGAGSGKSSICEAHCSSLINPGCDSFGIRVSAPLVLYVDTERSIPHTWSSWERCMRRAGLSANDIPDSHVLWHNIRGIPAPDQKQDWLFQQIRQLPTHALILLDGIGDLISDINDTEAATGLMVKLCAELHTRNLSCLATLHNNPAVNTEKARGVLGSELWRKCQAVAIIEKRDDDVRVLKTRYGLGKNRAGSDDIAISFKWDPELHYHVSCNEPVLTVPNKLVTQRNQILHAMGDLSWTYTDLTRMIMEDGKSERTAKRHVSDLAKIGKIKKNGDGGYRANLSTVISPVISQAVFGDNIPINLFDDEVS